MNLEDCGITREEVLDRLVDRLADSIHRSMEISIEKKVEEAFARRAQDIIIDRVSRITDKYLETPYQPVNSWGEKVGEPTSVAEIIETTFQTWWKTPVDKAGKPVSSSFYGSKMPRAQYVAGEIAADVLGGHLKNEYKKVVDDAKRILVTQLSAEITRQIEKLAE